MPHERKTVTTRPPPFPIGAAVRLRGCAFGEPGAVLRIERRKVVVYWQDLDFLSRHTVDSLILADADGLTGAGHGMTTERPRRQP
jgi:hypothetical protein